MDLIIARGKDSDSIIYTNILADAPSDHSYIVCDVCFPRPNRSKVEVIMRKIKCINIESFANSLEKCIFELEDTPLDESAGVLVNRYNSNLRNVLDLHAPLCNRTLTARPLCQWYTSELREEKFEVCRLERRYTKTGTLFDHDKFKGKCRSYRGIIDRI